jgi:hypothetical protein
MEQPDYPKSLPDETFQRLKERVVSAYKYGKPTFAYLLRIAEQVCAPEQMADIHRSRLDIHLRPGPCAPSAPPENPCVWVWRGGEVDPEEEIDWTLVRLMTAILWALGEEAMLLEDALTDALRIEKAVQKKIRLWKGTGPSEPEEEIDWTLVRLMTAILWKLGEEAMLLEDALTDALRIEKAVQKKIRLWKGTGPSEPD